MREDNLSAQKLTFSTGGPLENQSLTKKQLSGELITGLIIRNSEENRTVKSRTIKIYFIGSLSLLSSCTGNFS